MTPRTDAALEARHEPSTGLLWAGFSRQLETELAACRVERDEWRACATKLAETLRQIQHLAQGSADKLVCLAVIDRIHQISTELLAQFDALQGGKEPHGR
jgi:hypothetical protein